MECPYCGKEAEFVGGDRLYPHRQDLFNKKFYLCEPCGASVGTHAGGEPLGTMATAELKKARMAAHEHFDKFWKSGKLSRTDAYRELAHFLGIAPEACHIGMFGLDECKKVLEFRGREHANSIRISRQKRQS